jgi:RNA polymerase sigma-70 factor (ECF subfamily)
MAWEQSAPDPPDCVLVAQAKAGSETALARLTARYYQPIRLFLLRRTGDRDLADDLTQETFLRVLEHLADLRDDRRFRAWLYQIACRTCLMHRRRGAHTRIVPLDHAVDITASSAPSATDIRVQTILDALPTRLREVLVLHGLQEQSVPEVARTLGISVSAVYKDVSRAKKQFCALYATEQHRGENKDPLLWPC